MLMTVAGPEEIVAGAAPDQGHMSAVAAGATLVALPGAEAVAGVALPGAAPGLGLVEEVTGGAQ